MQIELDGHSPKNRPADGPEVLIIDDNEPTARALASLLGTAHYRTAVFHRGLKALEYAGQHPCAAAVVDIHLPDVSGLLVSQRLRESLGPAVPLVIVSGDTSMELLNSLSHVGATHFFSKPLNGSYLLRRLEEWLADAADQQFTPPSP